MTPPAPVPGDPPPARPRWRKWRRRAFRTALAGVVLIALVHRPVVFHGTKWLMVRLAKEQRLNLTYDIDGTIFTTLRVRNLKAVPTEPGPVERLECGEISLRYSLLDALRHGFPALLKELEIHDAWAVVDLSRSVPRPPTPGKSNRFPAVLPERLQLDNVNVVVRSAQGETLIEDANLEFDPAKTGVLRLRTLGLPGVFSGADITASTSVRNRTLILHDLVLGTDFAFPHLSLDTSRLDQRRLAIEAKASAFGGAAAFEAIVTDLNRTNRIDSNGRITGVSFDRMRRAFVIAPQFEGLVSRMSFEFAGVPREPAGWTGTAEAAVEGLVAGALGPTSVASTWTLADGRFTAAGTADGPGESRLAVDADGRLPETLDGWSSVPATAAIKLTSWDLAPLAAADVEGALTGNGHVRLADQRIAIDLNLRAPTLSASGSSFSGLAADIHAETDVAALRPALLLPQLSAQVNATAETVTWRGLRADTMALALEARDGRLVVPALTLTRGRNSARASADYLVPADLKSWSDPPLHASVDIDAPELAAFAAEGGGIELSGRLTAGGTVTLLRKSWTGRATATAADVRVQGVPLRSADASLTLDGQSARLEHLRLRFDDANSLEAAAQVTAAAPHAYQATLSSSLSDLSLFQPVINRIGKEVPIAGSLAVSWDGTGRIGTAAHTGTGSLHAAECRWGPHRGLSANATIDYSPDVVRVPELRLAAGPLAVRAVAGWANDVARLDELVVTRQAVPLVEGHAAFPFKPWNGGPSSGTWIPEDGVVDVRLESRNLNLASLLADVSGRPPPVNGIVNATLTATGTLRALAAAAAVRVSGLQAPAVKGLAPATAVIDVALADGMLTARGDVRQPRLAPVEVSGSMALDPLALTRGSPPDPKSPIAVRARLPRSSLEFLIPLAPQLRTIKGEAEIDLQVTGSLESPSLAGSLAADLDFLRFANHNLPPINESSVLIDLTRNALSIRRMSGRVAGGTFDATGRVALATLTDPVFDLRLVTTDALLVQNETLRARATSNVALTGPLRSATVSGNVTLTHSRFFKDIEILPIGLPGRPAPRPPPAPPEVRFPSPPIRDWTFNVAIKTGEPFLVEGNLANGRGIVDLWLKGTGANPWLEGVVSTDSLVTSLPFSRLEVTSGRAVFTSSRPFVPTLDLRAMSTIRDYLINVQIHGPADAPQAVFTSQPPLPQSEIVALLATGTTTRELSDPNVLAGRAAVLVFRKYYRKLFGKNDPLLPENLLPGNARLDVGTVDPKSGRESMAVHIPLNERVILSGGVDVEGDFRGQIKYVVRFR